ncbi:MAG: MBOAT family protein [Acidobacteriaceae bacterium]|nr:MBOAT family protein [Acidobacteriaceae bacterium]
MLFNSLAYAAFLPVVLAGYFVLPHRWRTVWLLAASCVFYMVYKPVYIVVLGGLITIDYTAGLCIERASRRWAKCFFWISISATIAVLGIFKYSNFIAHNVGAVGGFFNLHTTLPTFRWALPIGLSFHTFQSMAYVIEVYRGNQRAERNPIVYATYVMFFPQLVAGPIERPGHLLQQFREIHRFDAARIASGMKRIAFGLFKKAVIADRLALFVNQIFANPASFNGFYLAIASVAFCYQIYCDFSGYTDIAIGSAEMLGFRLVENFDSPFASRSISEFWRRWHMSLSNWFRDYVFIPLGGSRTTPLLTARNYMITFMLAGLWHGANWTFIVWGALNGGFLIAGRALKLYRDRLAEAFGLAPDHPVRVAFGIATTFTLFCVGMIFFRSKDLSEAVYFVTHLYRNWNITPIEVYAADFFQFKIAIAAILLLELVQFIARKPKLTAYWDAFPTPARWVPYMALGLGTILFGVYFAEGTFIYFQF